PVPGQAEFAGSGLDRGDDLVGDLLMDVKALFLHRFSPPWGLVAAAAATLPVGETGEGRGQAKSMRVVRAHKRSAEPRPCRFCLRGGRGSAPRLPLKAAGRPRKDGVRDGSRRPKPRAGSVHDSPAAKRDARPT